MKLLSAIALLTLAVAPAAAQTGNIHGANSRSEPIKAPYKASAVDPATGYTPGYTASMKSKAKKNKSKRTYISTSGSRY